MRITIPTGIFPPDIGGPASYVPRIAASLAAKGHSVEVITLSETGAADAEFPFPIRRILRRELRIPRMVKTIAAIGRSARQADLIYANGLFMEAAVAAALARKPLVMKIVGDWAWERARNHDAGDRTPEDFQKNRQSIHWEAVKTIRSITSRRPKRIISPSRYFADIIAGWGVPSSRISVVYNALDNLPDGLPPEWSPFRGRTLLTVARLVKWKGIEGLVELLTMRGDWRLCVVGDGPERISLESLADNLGVRKRIEFLGVLPRERVVGCMQKADVFILNSSYEGFSHVLLEALQAGIPVVATSAGGNVEIIDSGRNGLLVPVGDMEAMLNSLDRLFSESDLRSRLVDNGRRTVHTEYQWATLVEQTERILLDTAAGRSAV